MRNGLMIFNKLYILTLLTSFIYSTFSIVAIDTNTKEVGSAGGSCIANSIIISDLKPGLGAIHTQSYWMNENQEYASELMDQGYSAEEIVELLQSNDCQNNPSIRQYGIVNLSEGTNYGYLLEEECSELDNATWMGTEGSNETAECIEPTTSSSASFTGNNCMGWKGHINGLSYAIQGNILLNEDVLIDMEHAFINTNGSLDQKLMSALQGANIPGADTRCLDRNISTLSAFIRLAKYDDVNNYYMDLNINSVVPYYTQTGNWIDPIDTLQTLYNEWYDTNFEFYLGDINQDYIVNILDVVIVVNFIMNQNASGIEYYLSDLNEDDVINVQDIILILNIILIN